MQLLLKPKLDIRKAVNSMDGLELEDAVAGRDDVLVKDYVKEV